MEQGLQNLSALGVPISIGEAGVQSTISTTNGTSTTDASNVKIIDDSMRVLYGTPGVDTLVWWGWLQGDTTSLDSGAVLVNTNGSLTAAGTRYKYLMGTGTDPKAQYYSYDMVDPNNPSSGVNTLPFNTPRKASP